MKEDIVKEKKESNLFVPFLVGGLVGAGVALLFAPKSGKELRKDIRDLSIDTREMIASSIDKGKDLYEGSKQRSRPPSMLGKQHTMQGNSIRRGAGQDPPGSMNSIIKRVQHSGTRFTIARWNHGCIN